MRGPARRRPVSGSLLGGRGVVPGACPSRGAPQRMTCSGSTCGRQDGAAPTWKCRARAGRVLYRTCRVAFENRRTAGRALAVALGEYRGSQTVVLGITRGGMAVAAEVAAALHLPLDALVVHKIAEPGQPALGIATG